MKQDLIGTLVELKRTLAFDYHIAALEPSDETVFLAVAYPLADNVTGVKPRLPSGRGVSMPQALVAAGAEAVELRASLAQNNIQLISELPQVDGRIVVPAQNLSSGDWVNVPAQEVFLDFAVVCGEQPYADACSSGCAVGGNRLIATQNALLECIERDALALWWHAGLAPSLLDDSLLDASQPRLRWSLKNRERKVRLLGLQSEFGVPVVVAVSSDAHGKQVGFGAAARFDAGSAALAAVTELVQSEVSLNLAIQAGDPEALEWLAYASTHSLDHFNPVNAGPPATWQNIDQEALVGNLVTYGLHPLVVHLTLEGDPLPTVRVLVPGLCKMGGKMDLLRMRRVIGLALDDPAPKPHLPEPY